MKKLKYLILINIYLLSITSQSTIYNIFSIHKYKIKKSINLFQRLLEDKITKNILLYTPNDYEKGFLKPKPISDSIRKIDQQIQVYQRAIEKELNQKKYKERIEQLQKDGIVNQDGLVQYDYLTNPQMQNPDYLEDQEKILEPISKKKKINSATQKPTEMNIHQEMQKLQRIYDRDLDKAYLKREYAGLFSKDPKLYITSKTNQLKKTGEPVDDREKNYRIYNHENTPCVPQLIIPSFPNRKDMMAQCILDYLKDNTGMLQGDRIKDFPKCVQNIIEKAGVIKNINDKQHDFVNTLKIEKMESSHKNNIYPE